MKKTLIVLMMALLATMLIVSCKGDAEPKIINIKYDVNGGAPAAEGTYPTSATTGDVIAPTAPTRGGASVDVTNYDDGSFKYESATLTTTYNFKGWKVKGSEDSTAAASYTAGKEDVTLVAVWEINGTISNAKGIKLSSKVTKGKRVVLGKCNDGYNDDGIEWTVLAVDNTNNKALLFASYQIGSERAHISSGDYSWENSQINDWLNKTGNDGFISQCGLDEVKMVRSEVGNVFLLSKEEVTKYGVDKVRGYRWWLRDAEATTTGKALEINGRGNDEYVDATYNSHVLPAFWINISD